MNLNSAMRTSSTGMSAERTRLNVISANIANANSMRVNGHDPYRRHLVELAGDEQGVHVTQVLQDNSQLRAVSDPGNPNADSGGMVYYSNIEPINEMVDMMSASRAYEANIAAFNSAKSMIRSALTIGKV